MGIERQLIFMSKQSCFHLSSTVSVFRFLRLEVLGCDAAAGGELLERCDVFYPLTNGQFHRPLFLRPCEYRAVICCEKVLLQGRLIQSALS